MEEKKLTLEEKVDLLLAYQKKAHFWAKVRAVLSIILFFIFIILPIIWSFYFVRNLVAGMEPGQLDLMIKNIKAVKDLNLADSVSDFQNLMTK